MIVAIAYNMSGSALAKSIKSLLHQLDHQVLDCGSTYPEKDPIDLTYGAGQEILSHHADRAIVICSSGLCTCVAANKIKGLYAIPCYDCFEARVSRQKYNTNVLCLSTRWTDPTTACRITKDWLNTSFNQRTRDIQSLKKIETIETEQLMLQKTD